MRPLTPDRRARTAAQRVSSFILPRLAAREDARPPAGSHPHSRGRLLEGERPREPRGQRVNVTAPHSPERRRMALSARTRRAFGQRPVGGHGAFVTGCFGFCELIARLSRPERAAGQAAHDKRVAAADQRWHGMGRTARSSSHAIRRGYEGTVVTFNGMPGCGWAGLSWDCGRERGQRPRLQQRVSARVYSRG
jgi:hypothetical protein